MAENYELSEEELLNVSGGTNAPKTHEAYRCNGCKSEFATQQELKLHWDYHMECRKFANTCGHCGEKFATFQLLKQHWDYHMECRPKY